jgi:Flp pilus assembly pilin Flp
MLAEAGISMAKISRNGSILALVREFLVADERGATAIEYALVAAGVGSAVAATVFGLGSNVKSQLYNKIAALM